MHDCSYIFLFVYYNHTLRINKASINALGYLISLHNKVNPQVCQMKIAVGTAHNG